MAKVESGLIPPIEQRVCEYQEAGFSVDRAMGWESAVLAYKKLLEGDKRRAHRLWNIAISTEPDLEMIRGQKIDYALGFYNAVAVTLIGMRNYMIPDQSYYWTSEWQVDERAADKDIKNGRVISFSSPEAVVAYAEGLAMANILEVK